MFGAIAGGIASALAGGAMSKLFGGGQKAASGGIQGDVLATDNLCPSQFATRRTLFHVLVGCGLLMLKVSRLKLPVIWLLVSMWLNTLTKSQIWTLLLKV